MDECCDLFTFVYERMVVIRDKVIAMETHERLRQDIAVRDFSKFVNDFSRFLVKHKSKAWVYRVVTTPRVLQQVKSFEERINTLMVTFEILPIAAVADDRAVTERFCADQETAIAARLTDDATVTRAVMRVEQQTEALSVLVHELSKSSGSGAATSAAPDDTAGSHQLLTTALDKVIRRSSVHVREVPVWFCPPQDVEFETAAFAGGSFGTVHYGRMNHMDVVVKRLLIDTRTNANATTRFREEASLWFGFRHRHVLMMYGACDVSSPPFIVCELAANGNLFNYLSFERNRPRTFPLLHEAALGLAYLHANRVVHGDFKGDNILVSADPCAKIADFSFSYVRAMSASRQSVARAGASNGASSGGRSAGAIRWRAPECLKGRSPTFASDVFSFGMCILEAVSRQVPWGYRVDNDTVRDLVKSVELPERPAPMSDRVWSLVTRMCSLDPSNRPSLATVLVDLSELVSDTAEATTVDQRDCVEGAGSFADQSISIVSLMDESICDVDPEEEPRSIADVNDNHKERAVAPPPPPELQQPPAEPHKPLDVRTKGQAFAGNHGSWTRTGDGIFALTFESRDYEDVRVNIYSGERKITEVAVGKGANIAWSMRLVDLGDHNIYMDRWRPVFLRFPGTGGGLLRVWIPDAATGGHADLCVRLHAT